MTKWKMPACLAKKSGETAPKPPKRAPHSVAKRRNDPTA